MNLEWYDVAKGSPISSLVLCFPCLMTPIKFPSCFPYQSFRDKLSILSIKNMKIAEIDYSKFVIIILNLD
jgi:hypothetical protein